MRDFVNVYSKESGWSVGRRFQEISLPWEVAASSINPRHERGKCGGRWNSVRTACEHRIVYLAAFLRMSRLVSKSKSLPIFSAPLCVSYDDAYTYAFSTASSTNTFAFNRILNERAYKIVERIVAIFFPIVLRTSHFFYFFTFCIYFLPRFLWRIFGIFSLFLSFFFHGKRLLSRRAIPHGGIWRN